MLIKNFSMEKEDLNMENVHIVKRIIDDFERSERNRTKKPRKISRSDSLIHRCRAPKGHRVFHKSDEGPERGFHSGKARSLQHVPVRSQDSLSFCDFFERGGSVDNGDANSPKGLGSGQVGNCIPKGADEAKLAEEARKHQEKVRKNVKEVRPLALRALEVLLPPGARRLCAFGSDRRLGEGFFNNIHCFKGTAGLRTYTWCHRSDG